MTADLSATSLLQAILAVSAFHLGDLEGALNHKVEAIVALSQSFNNIFPPSEQTQLTQLAACMMLCVYSVSDWLTDEEHCQPIDQKPGL